MDLKNVLVITSSIDETVTYIICKYSNMVNFFRVDVDRFNTYRFYIDSNGWSIADEYSQIESSNVCSIYYRKPILPDLSSYDSQYHLMIQRDIISLINGIADSFPGKVLTRPSILRRTENKIYQLLYAGQKGLNIPSSYIGNHNDDCGEYEKSASIIKPITTGKTHGQNGWELYQTSMFSGIDEDISFTPVYLQNYIPKLFEVRITIIGENVYPIRIDTRNKVDWRADYENHKYSKIICPNHIIEKCYQLLEDFSLKYGAFDFIVTPKNEWVFLEVNPNGQWLWLEQSLELDISKKIVEYLVS